MKKNDKAIAWTTADQTAAIYGGELIKQAAEAAERAYAPYSGFKVGAALLLADGVITKGCNIENASYGATVCAERVAVWSAVAAGGLSVDNPPLALAVTATPCALCLQVLSEFAGPDMPILLPPEEEAEIFGEPSFRILRLGELLPHPFVLE